MQKCPLSIFSKVEGVILLLNGGNLNLTEDKKPKIFYGYIIVLISFCIQLVAFGIFSTFGVFFNPLLNEFGWTRTMLSGASSLAVLLLGFFAIIVGRLNDRIGPRIVMVGCGVLWVWVIY